MTAQRRQDRNGFGIVSDKSVWIAMLCLVLVSLLAFVQVAHFHTNDTDAGTCTLCVTMHSLLPEAVAATLVVLVSLGQSAKPAPVRVVLRRHDTRRFIRPPPADR